MYMYAVKNKWVSSFCSKYEDDYAVTICEKRADAMTVFKEQLKELIITDREYLVTKLFDYLDLVIDGEISDDFLVEQISEFVKNNDLFEYHDECDDIEVSIVEIKFGQVIQL